MSGGIYNQMIPFYMQTRSDPTKTLSNAGLEDNSQLNSVSAAARDFDFVDSYFERIFNIKSINFSVFFFEAQAG